MGARLKNALRSGLGAVLARLFVRRGNGMSRDWLWSQIRRFDDRDDTRSRALMKELFDIEIGRLTYGAYRVDRSINGGTRIGSFCSIAPGCRIGGTSHPLGFVSTHPFLYLANRGIRDSDDSELFAKLNAPVVIEDDVWVGAYAVVLPGVHIGRGAVVAAGAVVSKDVEPYTIVAGVPAKPIRQRLTPEQCRRLATIDWPSWSTEKLREELPRFFDVDEFLAAHEEPGANGQPAETKRFQRQSRSGSESAVTD